MTDEKTVILCYHHWS